MYNKNRTLNVLRIIITITGILILPSCFLIPLSEQIWRDILLAFSTTLLTTAAISWINKYMSNTNEQLENLCNKGIIDICDSSGFSDDTIDRIRRAKHIKGMFHTGKSFLRNCESVLVEAINNGCNVELLIASDSLPYNDDIMGHLCPGTNPAEEIRDSKITAHRIIDKINKRATSGKFTIKEYKFAPTGNVLIIDDFVRYVPYLPNCNSHTSIAIMLTSKAPKKNMFDRFDAVFSDIWKEIDISIITS